MRPFIEHPQYTHTPTHTHTHQNLSPKGEIIALAIELSKGTIYTVSRYSFSVIHAHGAIWKERALLNATTNKIKYGK
jgi:hypothetical protein